MQIPKPQLPFNPKHDFLSIVTYSALGRPTRECPHFGLHRLLYVKGCSNRARCVSWLARTLPAFRGAMQLDGSWMSCVVWGRSWNQEGLLGKDVDGNVPGD